MTSVGKYLQNCRSNQDYSDEHYALGKPLTQQIIQEAIIAYSITEQMF